MNAATLPDKGWHLELLLSDADYYHSATDDPQRDIFWPWQEWINEIGPMFSGEIFDIGIAGGSCLARFAFWDIRWVGERCDVLVQDSETGDEDWWTPPVPAPAALMRFAQRVDNNQSAGGEE